jgi:hypothetical protein
MTLNFKPFQSVYNGLHSLAYELGFVFDPVKDKDDLPVVKQRKAAPTKTRTRKANNVLTMCDGKDYLYTEDIDESTGLGTITLDSEAVRVKSDRTAAITKHDTQVFDDFKSQDEYSFFNMGHYELIKRVAWAKGLSYRKAYKLSAIKNLDGCGEKRLAIYYKAINQANRML